MLDIAKPLLETKLTLRGEGTRLHSQFRCFSCRVCATLTPSSHTNIGPNVRINPMNPPSSSQNPQSKATNRPLPERLINSSSGDNPARHSFSPSRTDISAGGPARSRHSSGSSVQSFGLSVGTSAATQNQQHQHQHHVSNSLHSSHRARALTSSSPRVASPTAGSSSLSQGVGHLAGGAGISRLARHSPSLSLSTAGSPVSSSGPHSAAGSSGQLTSLVITQLNILLSTTKDDGDPAKWQTQVDKIQRLVDENGMEVFSQYFRRLLQSNAAIIFGNGQQQLDTSAAGNYQLLVKELQRLTLDPHEADKIAEALDTSDGELFRNFDLSAFVNHFKIPQVAKFALLLPLRKASKLDLRSKGKQLQHSPGSIY